MNDSPKIVSIVEGDGELSAVPVLIQKIGLQLEPPIYVEAWETILTRRDTIPRFTHERERVLREAQRAAGTNGAILVLLDSDGEPPCRHSVRGAEPCLLGEDLRVEVERLLPDVPTSVVFANRMYEAWFLAAASSIADYPLFLPTMPAIGDPETEVDPKALLTSWMRPGEKYKPTRDQVKLTNRMDVQMARQASPSFAHAYGEIERLIRAVCQT